MKIMFCHDGSARAQKALKKTIDYFSSQKPEMVLLTVAEEPHDASMVSEENFEKWKSERHDELKKAAESVVREGLEVDAILAVGDPREMIIEAINKKSPDLVVVARRGKSEVGKMLLGSVSAYVIRHAERPVLVMTLKKNGNG